MPSIAEFAAFFDRYRQSQQEDHGKWAAYMARLRSELPRLQAAVRCEALRDAPHFNVFRILNVVHKEAGDGHDGPIESRDRLAGPG